MDEIEYGIENGEEVEGYTAIVEPPLNGEVSDEEDGDEDSSSKKCSLNKFRTAVAESLLAENRVEKRTILTQDDRFDGMNHMIAFNEKKQNRCRQCQKNTSFECEKCHVFLHPKHCFKLFHSK